MSPTDVLHTAVASPKPGRQRRSGPCRARRLLTHLPRRYGSWRSACTRLRRQVVDGFWEWAFIALLDGADEEEPDWPGR